MPFNVQTFSGLVKSRARIFGGFSVSAGSLFGRLLSETSLGLDNFRLGLFSISSGKLRNWANFFDKSSVKYSETIP